MDIQETKENKKKKVKVPPESIRMDIFGDIIKFTKKNPKEIIPMRKYDTLAIAMLSEDKIERIITYMFLCALVLSSHARRTAEVSLRKNLFDIKNKLYLGIANNPLTRNKVNFRYCVSKRFKVTSYCEKCQEKNMKVKNKREWKFCRACVIDRSYYNVLSMFHKNKFGAMCIFLGKELLHLVQGLKPVPHVKLEEQKEAICFKKYKFDPHNLIAIDLASCITVSNRLLWLLENESKKTQNNANKNFGNKKATRKQ